MNIKIVGLTVAFVLGLGFILLPFWQKYSDSNASLSDYSMEMPSNSNPISQDFYNLHTANKIPPMLFKLKEIKITYHDKELRSLIPRSAIPLKTSRSGQYNLEIEAFSASEEKTKIVVLQMNIVENKSGNKVFELSRNYEFKEAQKEKPD